MDKPDDRIRMVFGLTSDDPLPKGRRANAAAVLRLPEGPFVISLQGRVLPHNKHWSQHEWQGDGAWLCRFLRWIEKAGIVCEGRKGEAQSPSSFGGSSRRGRRSQLPARRGLYLLAVGGSGLRGRRRENPHQFPIGTVAYYGPDDKITTKIVAGVIKEEGAEPIIKRWVATDVTTNPKVPKEIDRFFKKYGVKRVGMTGKHGLPT